MPEAHSKHRQYNNQQANMTCQLNAESKRKCEAETKTLERCKKKKKKKNILDEVLKETSPRIRIQTSPEAGDEVKLLRGNLKESTP